MGSIVLKKQKIKQQNRQSLQKHLLLFIFVSVLLVFVYWFSLNIVKPKAIPITATKTRVHGNDDDNCRLHIVYEIYAIDTTKVRETLKYGISSQCDFITKDGNPRPEYQIPNIKMKPKYKGSIVWYEILHRNIPNRKMAKKIEQDLINEFFYEYKEMPSEQLRPLPKMNEFFKL